MADDDETDPLANFDLLPPPRQRRRKGVIAWPYVSITNEGEGLIVHPGDATITAWNEEQWSLVTVGFSKDRTELALTKSTSDLGNSIRRNHQQRVQVYVGIKSVGRARLREPLGTCTVRRIGDTFFFNIAEQVTIEPR